MIATIPLTPGVTLRCFSDTRFKQSCLSFQLVRPMCRREATYNALLPAILLRGTQPHPDIRSITLHLDDLYGASVGTLVRRVGDYQTCGLYCGFIEDAYAMEGDAILEPMVAFLRELLLQPLTEDGVFLKDFVEGEKRNLLSAIDSQRNDKRIYAASRLRELMCPADSFGIPRLGFREDVDAVTAEALYRHYQTILRESRIDIFYVGSVPPRQVADLLMPMLQQIPREVTVLPAQTAFHTCPGRDETEVLDVAQGKLCMGFLTPITLQDPRFAAMQICNTILGSGMTNKLFTVIREQMSLCYDIGSGYHGSKGILTVSAGIDSNMDKTVRQEILHQISNCQEGNITPYELEEARQALITQLQQTHDSPVSIENYYSTAALSGMKMTPEAYIQAVRETTLEQVVEAANTLQLHSVYFLKGVQA